VLRSTSTALRINVPVGTNDVDVLGTFRLAGDSRSECQAVMSAARRWGSARRKGAEERGDAMSAPYSFPVGAPARLKGDNMIELLTAAADPPRCGFAWRLLTLRRSR
jgi:hypothetical protein